ncbi:MAG: glycosyltransferase [Patescibacteria group bacterium]
MRKPRVALVADWLTNRGGAERVILALRDIFPHAPVYTSVYNPDRLPGFENCTVVTSFIQKLPFAKTKHFIYLPLMPYAFEQFDFSNFDIVISSAHSAAKGIITKPRTLHISYCHSPMRYCWDNSHEYVEQYGIPSLLRRPAERLLSRLRVWDRVAADRVDFFIANSKYIKKRIQKYYRRDSTVIYPPVDTSFFGGKPQTSEYYLAVGRLTPYKKFDLIIEVFNELKWPLVIVGDGKDMNSLKKKAGPTIRFLGNISDEELRDVYMKAKALVFPQVEDFGIAPVEAMSAGKPVIAYAEGGALETINPGLSGLFFEEQKPESLKKALLEFEAMRWTPSDVRKHAGQFDKKLFQEQILQFVEEKWGIWSREMA